MVRRKLWIFTAAGLKGFPSQSNIWSSTNASELNISSPITVVVNSFSLAIPRTRLKALTVEVKAVSSSSAKSLAHSPLSAVKVSADILSSLLSDPSVGDLGDLPPVSRISVTPLWSCLENRPPAGSSRETLDTLRTDLETVWQCIVFSSYQVNSWQCVRRHL